MLFVVMTMAVMIWLPEKLGTCSTFAFGRTPWYTLNKMNQPIWGVGKLNHWKVVGLMIPSDSQIREYQRILCSISSRIIPLSPDRSIKS